ncbi:uncharacterized protein RAG0_16002 [Rhynchosporium agropyri]|uniref:Uncharacterized protein n=1 Tax=Rhynchosporium agropyri TaxID=914238 RepID=A0A1E1LNB3_9HELO|nr:uncharacterized protein RAG0_16002 [Rhynchosporium agropyri]
MARLGNRHLDSYWRTQLLQLFPLIVTKVVDQQYLSKAFAHPSGAIFFFNFCIRLGESITIAEAHPLRSIAEHTSNPYQEYTMLSLIAAKPDTHGKASWRDHGPAWAFPFERLEGINFQSTQTNDRGIPVYDL